MPLRTIAATAIALACVLGFALESRSAEVVADVATDVPAEVARYGFEITLTPAGPAGRYHLLAAVRDLDHGKVVAAPTMIFEAGEPARITSEVPEREHQVMVEARVSEDQKTAEIVFQTISNHRSLTFARTTITLPGS